MNAYLSRWPRCALYNTVVKVKRFFRRRAMVSWIWVGAELLKVPSLQPNFIFFWFLVYQWRLLMNSSDYLSRVLADLLTIITANRKVLIFLRSRPEKVCSVNVCVATVMVSTSRLGARFRERSPSCREPASLSRLNPPRLSSNKRSVNDLSANTPQIDTRRADIGANPSESIKVRAQADRPKKTWLHLLAVRDEVEALGAYSLVPAVLQCRLEPIPTFSALLWMLCTPNGGTHGGGWLATKYSMRSPLQMPYHDAKSGNAVFLAECLNHLNIPSYRVAKLVSIWRSAIQTSCGLLNIVTSAINA